MEVDPNDVARALCDIAREHDSSVTQWDEASSDVKRIYRNAFLGFVKAIERVGYEVRKKDDQRTGPNELLGDGAQD
jgi:hypothetical protein